MITQNYFDECIKISDELHDTFKIQEIDIEKKNFNIPLNVSISKSSISDLEVIFKIDTKVLLGNPINSIYKIIQVVLKAKKIGYLADFRITYSFEIVKNLDFVSENNDDYLILPIANEFLDNIVIATTRGIMSSELRGTFLGNYILPITKPEKKQTNFKIA